MTPPQLVSVSEPESTAPSCDVDFYDDATVADPASAYQTMLAAGPIVWLHKNQLHAICGHDALVRALRNHQSFSSAKGVSIDDAANRMIVGSTLNSDPPAHDTTRAITFSPLSPKALEEVRAQIEKEAKYIADKVVGQGSFDAAKDLAPHLPLTIVRDLVGLGDYGKDNMLDWGAATFELMGDPGPRRAAAINNLKKMRSFLDDPKTLHGLSPDGWAQRATHLGIQSGMAPERAVELMRDYIAPSLDTTISAIGYAMMLFARFPDQWARLKVDRSLMKGAIEEIVRLNTPIRAFSRVVTKPTKVAGVNLQSGLRVLMVYGAANRDPARFEDPDSFNITRKTSGHVGFGYGVHSCLGMHLARLEMTCLFNALADRVERFELTGEIVPGVNSTIHSLASVPVRVVT
ncbi:MAG: cytochrome P450 [Burkholderiaceae bacterium]